MPTQKQLTALARGRAIRMSKSKRQIGRINCKRTYKGTNINIEINKEKLAAGATKVKNTIVDTSKKIGAALKSFTNYIRKCGLVAAVKNSAITAANTLKGQSERLSYMNFLLSQLNRTFDDMEDKPDKQILTKMSKNAKILIELSVLEKEENPQLPKKFVRDIHNLKNNIDLLLEDMQKIKSE